MHIPSPGFAPSAEVAGNFFASEPVATALEHARKADMVMVAVGVIGAETLLVQAGYLDEDAMEEIIAAGAVGEVFGLYYDADGNAVKPDALHPISLTLDDLRASKRVIAAAGGVEKVEPVKGAIAAGIIDELAIDDGLARALLA